MADKKELVAWVARMSEKMGGGSGSDAITGETLADIGQSAVSRTATSGRIRGSEGSDVVASERAAEVPQSGGSQAMTCTVTATRNDRSGRFKVAGKTAAGAKVKIHRLEGGCNPVNAHPMPFAEVTAAAGGSFTFKSTTITAVIPGVGKKVIAIATKDGRSAFGCATVVPG